jgi:hypothetical protein
MSTDGTAPASSPTPPRDTAPASSPASRGPRETGTEQARPGLYGDGSTVPAQPETTGPRTGTVVGGLVLVLLGLGVAAVGAGATLDLQAALIVLLFVAGAALLVGAALGSRRGRR